MEKTKIQKGEDNCKANPNYRKYSNIELELVDKICQIRTKLKHYQKATAAVIYTTCQDLERLCERNASPPHGPLIIASILKELGFKVDVLIVDSIKSLIDMKNYDLYAISVLSSISYPKLNIALKKAKMSNNLKLIGGFHASLYPIKTLKECCGNILIIGEGELPLNYMFNLNYDFNQDSLESIKGIIYTKRLNANINERAEQLKDFNLTPFPDLEFLPPKDFILKHRLPPPYEKYKVISILCSRGCPYQCYFCANQPEKIRSRDPIKIRHYLRYYKDKFDIQGFIVSDETFTFKKRFVLDFCNEIKDLNLKWSITTRVDRVDPFILKTLYEAGCIEIKFGAESGNQRLLNSVNKSITIEQIKSSVKLAYQVGFFVKLLIIHGLPGETLQTTRDTIQLLKRLKPYIYRVTLFNFTPLPGSKIWLNTKKFNIRPLQEIQFQSLRIHSNDSHYWGSKQEYKTLLESRKLLKKYIEKNFNEQNLMGIKN